MSTITRLTEKQLIKNMSLTNDHWDVQETRYWELSECCGAPLIEEQNMCSRCKEYALSRSAAADMRAVEAEHKPSKEERERKAQQEECPHDEHDHGICLHCRKDVWDDVVSAAEFRAECLEDR